MIGVVGGGQLARMLVQAASSRQVGVAVQTTSSQDPAAEGAARLVNADSRDVAGTRELVQGCAGITFENEWVNDALIPWNSKVCGFVRPWLLFRPWSTNSQRQLLADLNILASGFRSAASLQPNLLYRLAGHSP